MIRTLICPQQAQITLDLPAEYIGKDLEVIVFATVEGLPAAMSPKRFPGSLKGKIKMADDFDRPLDDFQEYQ